ncbi:hypothetical protein QMY03_09430 [Arthrobacter sp. KFRI-F3372]|uniref:hypothetical protein n=1 Tax=unclassified Pseudarthrobacter TaxID=2647000 RepID=UPI0027A4F2CC|nr:MULTISPECIES: hypothetical protein [unclassified Pseudarthrobacter]MEE2523910.1 hypothetical protein [Pseudarthrobacter sp. J47]MEE2530339.1 hypothetical protein [Pseudarthrobacter sp. J75]WHP61098.1 hypothetical protein QMY03_09430 [Arthrobacter sp. KFRI-F3372]
MNSIGKSLTAALTLTIVSVLGAGAAAGAEHPQHPASHAPVSVTAPAGLLSPPGTPVYGPPPGHHAGPAGPQAAGQDLHREERLVEDEREHAEAAPHTLGRFDSGSA